MAMQGSVADLTYLGVTVYSASRAFVISVMDELAEQNSDHSLVLRWANGSWSQTPVVDSVIGSCVVNEGGPKLVNVCVNGEVELLVSQGTAHETIDTSENRPNNLNTLRTARTIGGQVYAAGMARRVYRRAGPNRWQAIDQGIFVPRTERTQSVGFLSIDGFASDDIYAAGYKGEIWHYDGTAWTNQQSPTNLALSTVRCAAGLVYIAGLAGTLIRGSAGAWEAIQQNVTSDDFWGATVFKGAPYFATNKAVYRLVGDDLEAVDFGSLGQITTGHLDCDSEIMWSAGSKHLASTRDGVKWEAVPGPQ